MADGAVVQREELQLMPQVAALDPNAPHTRRWLERMLSFPNTAQTEETRQRTELYRERRARAAVLDAPLDYSAMMASLGLRVEFGLRSERNDPCRGQERLARRSLPGSARRTRQARGPRAGAGPVAPPKGRGRNDRRSW